MLIRQFIIKTGLLVLVTSTLCIVLFLSFFANKFNILYPILPVFFGAVNVSIFYFLLQVKDSTLIKFSNRYLLCTTIKLFGSFIFVVVYLLLKKNDLIPFLSTFLSVYFIFLFQEIVSILKFFQKNEKSETTHAKT